MNGKEQTEDLPGFTIEAPAEVTVQRGLCVLIPCNFTVGPGYNLTKDAIGIWYKGHLGGPVAASTVSSRFPDTTNRRFIFTGKVSAGDCSFSISDAQPGDTDQYYFRLEGPLKINYLHIQPNVSVTGFTIEVPAEVTVQRGLCVLIPCNFTVGPSYNLTKDAIGIWYKGYNGHPNGPVAASTDSSQFPDTTNGRFIFTGKVSAGDCSFSISDAQPGDTDQYWFRLEDRDNLRVSFLNIQPTVSVTGE
ncbi:hypothetical protein XELAEV_18036309mg [Xenopus laevis]|uniref:Immunoglobulin domain-containing protein n=1 Tax=Xenopus laevis TaxID=8355 RepID=A0A974CHB3_XENLA|nr:hypothetical protein XELAEV_18036309mg [Xenopus laevis]